MISGSKTEHNNKGKKKITIILITAAVVAAAALIVLLKLYSPGSRYDNAVKKMNAGQYGEAYEEFRLIEYKDSAELAQTCLFLKQKKDLPSASVGSTVLFGTYEQDNDLSNGKEEIEWIVLEVEEDSILVISKCALDCQLYNSERTGVTWETSALRSWLNGTFYDDAFNDSCKELIKSVTVTADKNPDYYMLHAYAGNDTTDCVFMLSIIEVNRYYNSNDARQCSGTDYCYAQGAHKAYNDNCSWWLRTPGMAQERAATVRYDGLVGDMGSYVDREAIAVRPALWIDLGE